MSNKQLTADDHSEETIYQHETSQEASKHPEKKGSREAVLCRKGDPTFRCKNEGDHMSLEHYRICEDIYLNVICVELNF